MKPILFFFLLLVSLRGFSQPGALMYLDTAGAEAGHAMAFDTSSFPDLRNRIADQSLFIRLDSSNSNAYIRRAMLRFQVTDYAGSISDYDKLIAWFPNSTEAYSNRGMDYCMLKNYPAALTDMNKALQLSPDPMSYKLRALIKTYLKDFSGALADLDTAIAIKPDYVEGYCNKAGTLLRMGKPKDALQVYNKAIELDPQCWEAYSGRAETRARLKDDEGVIADSQQLLKLQPGYGDYTFYEDLSAAYSRKGDKASAGIYAGKAAELKKKSGIK